MLAKSWKHIIHFIPREFDDPLIPNSHQHISSQTVILLDKLRCILNRKIITHWKIGGCVDVNGSHGHSDDSRHLVANGSDAVDFHIDTNMNIWWQYNYVCQCGFGGIGVYLWWKHPGFHVDCRLRSETLHWISRQKGQYEYFR